MHRNRKFWKKVKNTASDYVQNSSIPGYRYLSSKNTLERYFWYTIHICILALTFKIIQYLWSEFMDDPIITTVESFTNPIKDVPMPAVSICNNNKISRNEAQIYAEKLSNVSGIPQKEIFLKISNLAKLYDLNRNVGSARVPFHVAFQSFLDTYDPDSKGYCNVHDTLKRLTKPCSELITDCWIHDKKRNCDDLLVTELTMEGFCCIFNYVSEGPTTMSKILKENNNRPISAGDIKHNGDLTFKLWVNKSDYTFTTIASLGVEILISLPADFPDKTSGGLRELLVGLGEEVFIGISSITTVSTDEIRKYPLSQRGCVFRSEKNTIFGGYSHSDCIMDCKIKSILEMCRCVPFNFINALKGLDYRECTLTDLECLSTHSGKWSTVFPAGYTGDELKSERQNSISCSHCLPACSDTLYHVKSERTKIFTEGKVKEDFSVVHVSFTSSFEILNKQDAVFYWYEITGLFGGLCSLIMGVSFISLVEILYYLSRLFFK